MSCLELSKHELHLHTNLKRLYTYLVCPHSCVCPDGFDGPNCEQTKLNFNGDSWAWFDHIPACETLNIRFQFMTQQPNALLLYNGPMFNQANTVTVDYLAIQIVDGYPQSMVDIGNIERALLINGLDTGGTLVMDPLNDGEWHTIEYYMSPGVRRKIPNFTWNR